MKSKIIAVLLIAAVMPSAIYAQSRFTDMNGYEWAQSSVENLYLKGIIKGTSSTHFSPAAEIKRGDFALMTARFFELEGGGGRNYSDVENDLYYAGALLSIKTLGAYTGDEFEPERPITREEAAGLIYNVIYNTVGFNEEQFSENAAQYYSDAGEIKWDKVNAAATLANMGIMQGDNGKFFPKNTLTRAETAVLFSNLDMIKNSALTVTPSPAPDDIGAILKITENTSDKNKQYQSAADNMSVVWVKDSSYTADSVTMSKISGISANAEKSRLMGLNAAFLSENSSSKLVNASVMSSADDSDAVFANEGSRLEIYDSALIATGAESSSAAAAGGSEITIRNTRLSAAGKNSPSLKVFSSGTISCDGIYIVTSGDNSAGVYAAGKTVLNNSTLSTNNSYMTQIDGGGEVSSFGSSYSGRGIMIYQSGDEGMTEGMGKFSAYNSKISSSAEALFYVTNTDAEINLTASELSVPSNGLLVKAVADEWGNEGANGGHVSVNAQNQTLSGDIVTDGISSVTLNLMGRSVYSGALNRINYTGAMNVSVSGGSTWSLTADSYINAIQNEDETYANIRSNGYNIFYDPSAAANTWLDGKTIPLNGGGELKPAF